MDMKKTVMSALLSLIITMCAAANGKIGVVFIGNSITQGALLADPQQDAPPVRAASYLGAETGEPVEFRNCGVSGATTLDFLPAADRLFGNAIAAADELKGEGCSLFFSISLGTNDSACSGPLGAPVIPAQYYTNLKVIIDDLMVRYPGSRFVVQYPIWYSPTTYNGAIYLKAGLERLQSYMPEIERLVRSYSVSHPGQVFGGSRAGFDFFRDHYADYFTKEQGFAGEFYLHPNKEGADRLGEIWGDGLVKALGGRLTLMSFNVRNGCGFDGKRDHERTAAVIRQQYPDVVAVQEVDSVTRRSGNRFVLAEIASLAGMEYTFAKAIDYDGGEYGIGILSREKPVSVTRYALPGREEARAIVVAEFKDFVYASTHLSLTYEDCLASVDIIKDIASKYDKPFILAGDFNAHPTSKVIKSFAKDFDILTDISENTFPADKPSETIDYIMVYKATNPEIVRVSSNVVNEPAASDHRPVVARVKLP